MDAQRKWINGVCKKSTVSAADGIYEATISTTSLDRQGEVVIATGMQADNYMANPVVLYDHDYGERGGLPVAKTLSLTVTTDAITAKFQFPPKGASVKADEVHALWDAGFLNAVSIGFLAMDYAKDAPVFTITSWELLEFSICSVPANPQALRRTLGDSLTMHMDVDVKEGRVLSKHNLELVQAAIEALTALRDAAEPQDGKTLEGSSEPDKDADAEGNDDHMPVDQVMAALFPGN